MKAALKETGPVTNNDEAGTEAANIPVLNCYDGWSIQQ